MIFQPYTSRIPSSGVLQRGEHNQRAGHRPVGQHSFASTTAGSRRKAAASAAPGYCRPAVVAKQPLQRQRSRPTAPPRMMPTARYAPAQHRLRPTLNGNRGDGEPSGRTTADRRCPRAVANAAQLEDGASQPSPRRSRRRTVSAAPGSSGWRW